MSASTTGTVRDAIDAAAARLAAAIAEIDGKDEGAGDDGSDSDSE